jgi:hypothetical protein
VQRALQQSRQRQVVEFRDETHSVNLARVRRMSRSGELNPKSEGRRPKEGRNPKPEAQA